jgi:hypothetical protein
MKSQIVMLMVFLFLSFAVVADGLFELKSGLSWTYEVEGGNTRKVTNKIHRSAVINGIRWYEMVEYGERFWIRNSDLGQVEAINLYEREPEKNQAVEEAVIFKYPAKIGQSWEVYGGVHTYKGMHKLTVPAGTYECHMYQIDMDGGSYNKSCIAEDIGVIYSESLLEGKEREVSRLISYSE